MMLYLFPPGPCVTACASLRHHIIPPIACFDMRYHACDCAKLWAFLDMTIWPVGMCVMHSVCLCHSVCGVCAGMCVGCSLACVCRSVCVLWHMCVCVRVYVYMGGRITLAPCKKRVAATTALRTHSLEVPAHLLTTFKWSTTRLILR